MVIAGCLASHLTRGGGGGLGKGVGQSAQYEQGRVGFFNRVGGRRRRGSRTSSATNSAVRWDELLALRRCSIILLMCLGGCIFSCLMAGNIHFKQLEDISPMRITVTAIMQRQRRLSCFLPLEELSIFENGGNECLATGLKIA